MTDNIISNNVLKYVQAMVESTYHSYDIEDIIFLLNSTEEEFEESILSVARKRAGTNSFVQSVVDCTKQDFVNMIMSCEDVKIFFVVKEKVKTYKVAISNKVIENHMVNRFRNAGVEIIESIEETEHKSLIALFWV